MREERFPWGLGAILVLVIVGGIGFWLGSSSVSPVIVPVAAPVAPAPAPVTPVYPTYAPHDGGFPFFPFFLGLIFLFVIFKFVRRAAWASHSGGQGWYGGGPGAWGGHGRGWRVPESEKSSTAPPPMADEMFQRWHARMHGEETTDSLDLPPTDPPTNASA